MKIIFKSLQIFLVLFLGISNTSTLFSQTISGTIFEDVNYAGGAGRNYTTADNSASALSFYSTGDIGVNNVTVELWDSSGTTLITSTTTNVNGVYSFTSANVSYNTTYRIRVVNSTVSSNRPYVSGASNTEVGIQTYRVESTDGLGGLDNIDSEVGGKNPMNIDVSASVFTGAQSWSTVSMPASSNVSGINFGFNFSTIVNTNDSGQGSLRQFVLNSNKLDNDANNLAQDAAGILAGNETSIFMIPVTIDPLGRTPDSRYQTSGASSGVSMVSLVESTGDIFFTDNNTHIDGRTQTNNIGTDTNPGEVGTGGTVGVDNVPFGKFQKIEVLINLDENSFRVQANDCVIRNLGFYNGGDKGYLNSSNLPRSDNKFTSIWVESTVTSGALVTENIFGYLGDGVTTPSTAELDNQITAIRVSGLATIENNYIGNYSAYDILVTTIGTTIRPAAGSIIRGNESAFKTNPGLVVAEAVYIDVYAIYENNVLIENNLIQNYTKGSKTIGNNGGAGIELYQEPTGITIRNNTIDGMPISGIYIADNSDNTTITKNIIRNTAGLSNVSNSGIGVLGSKNGTGTPENNLISQNAIYNNATIGIDLASSSNVFGLVSKNDNGDGDGGANGQLNFPILDEASLDGNNLTIKGFSRPGATIEFFIADTDINGAASPGDNTFSGSTTDYGEGQVYLFSLVEGSLDDDDTTTGSYNVDGNTETNTNKFEVTLDISTLSLPAGFSIDKMTILTSTATLNNNTSEFSPTKAVIDPNDYDCDGINNIDDIDDDNDGIPDIVEGTGDFDGDGIPNDRDLDSDGDGIPDLIESGNPNVATLDTNNDGQIDITIPVGANGLANAIETNDSPTATTTYVLSDTESDNKPDYLDIDSDNDGIIDNIEAQNATSYIAPSGNDLNANGIDDSYDNNPITPVNSDNNGKPNYQDIDSDNDGIPDNVEGQTTAGYIAPSGNDTDGDGLDDNYDNSVGVPNSNGITPVATFTIADYVNTDTDIDGIPDIEENGMANTLSGVDSDGDGLDDNFEGSDLNDGFDVNDEINIPANNLPNTTATGDVDYRENDIQLGPYKNGALWLRADIGASANTWLDQSGYNRDFIKTSSFTPSVTNGSINFNPGVSFHNFLRQSYEHTGALNPRSMFIVYNDTSTQTSTTPFTNDTGIGDGYTNDSRIFSSSIHNAVSFGSNYINGKLSSSGSIARPDSYEMHSRIFISNPSPNNETYYLGKDNTLSISTDGAISGRISEVILYSDLIIPKERQVVESYLAIKYGFTLDITDNNGTIVEGDYVISDETTKVWDYAANATFHHNVAGIGKDDGWNLLQKQSKSSNQNTLVTIGLNDIALTNQSNNGSLINKNYLVWGHNNVALATTSSTIPNVPSQAQCVSNERLDRVWKIVETGSVGITEVAFDKTIIDTHFTTLNSQKILVISDDAAFTNNVVEVELEEESINFIPSYTGKYNFNGTKYFTIADKKEIEWLGATSEWKRGSGVSNSPNTTDTGRLLIIDSGVPNNHATIVDNVKVECAYIKTGSKLVVPSGKYIEIQDDLVLDGEIRLVGDGQLIQTHSGASKIHGTGKLYKDQQAKVPSIYRYHYWSSPVVETGLSTFRVGEVLKDGIDPTDETSIPQPITWTTGYDGAPGSGTYPSSYIPITISNHWIYTNLNDPGDGTAWVQQRETGVINKGQGFAMKSTGDSPQNLTFLGTPNDGTITFNINPEPATHLLGNPYPSSLDMTDFINDNISSIDGTLYFWEHTGEDSATLTGSQGHNQLDYQGGYSQRNLTMGISAVNVPTSNSGLYDWENATDNGNDVTQLKTITLDNTDYDITATVSIDDTFGLDIIDKQGAGGSTAKVIVKNSGLSSDGFKITFDNLVDVSSIYLYNDIASQTATNDITITANNPSSNTTVTETLTGGTGQIISINWTDVTEITIISSSPNNLVLDDISFAKGGEITTGNGTYHEPNRYMAVGQGFFVSASATGGQIIFQNSQREYQDDDFASGGTFFFKGKEKKEEKPIPILKLGMDFKHNSINYHRQIGISFKNGNSFSYENGYDSEMYDIGPTDMFWGFDEISDKKLIIAGVEDISDELEVLIHIDINNSQIVKIKIDEEKNIDRDVFIFDKVTNIYHNLKNRVELNLEKGNYKNRFYLTFNDSTLNLEENSLLNKSINLFFDSSTKEMVLQNKDNLIIEKIELYTILGQKINEWNQLKPVFENRFKVKNISTTFYILNVKTDKGFMNKKIVIK